jgi:hypothetical protein
MTRFLIAAAALAAAGAGLPAAPAAAVDRPGLAEGPLGVTVHRGFPISPGMVSSERSGRFDRRRGFGDVGYLAVPEYQGDSAFRSEGFNDWWHSRPDRNEPRWLRSNNCERQFWTGSGWRC